MTEASSHGQCSSDRGWRIRADGTCRHVCAVWGRRSMHATICMPWAFIVALWHVEEPTMGAYIAPTGVATYAPPA